MPLNRIFVLSAFLLLMFALPALADDAAHSYFELADAPKIAVDWNKGSTQSVTLGSNRTVTFSNGQKGGKYSLIVKQDAHGSRIVTWPTIVHWPGGSAITLTGTANKKDYITFFYDGVSYDVVGFTQNL